MHVGWGACFLAITILCIPSATASARIEGFATDLPNHEDAIEIRNTGNDSILLDGLRLSDNAGTLGFPDGASLPPNQRVFLTTNSSAFLDAFGRAPDFSLTAGEDAGRLVRLEGSFALSNSGDRIVIVQDGSTLDIVIYGSHELETEAWNGDPVDTPGTMFLRWFPRTHETDTDSVRDWLPARRSYAGE